MYNTYVRAVSQIVHDKGKLYAPIRPWHQFTDVAM